MTLFALTAQRIPLDIQIELILRVVLAVLCGSLIGIERGLRYKGAGIRTHSMVACTAAVLMIVSKYGFTDMVNAMGQAFPGAKDADPARIAAQVVSGISFLGVGVIYRDRKNTTKGLTTAAGIWAVAGIGLAIGAGMYVVGVFTTATVIAIQFFMHKIPLAQDNHVNQKLEVVMQDTPATLDLLGATLDRARAVVFEERIRRMDDGMMRCSMLLRLDRREGTEAVSKALMSDGRVRSVDWNEADD